MAPDVPADSLSPAESDIAHGRRERGRSEIGSSIVTIRFATSEADIDARLEFGKRLHRESVYARLPYDEDKVRKTLRRALKNPNRYCLLMAEIGAESIGTLYGQIGEHAFSRALGAAVHTYYVTPDRRGITAAIKLLHGFRRWAAQRGRSGMGGSSASG